MGQGVGMAEAPKSPVRPYFSLTFPTASVSVISDGQAAPPSEPVMVLDGVVGVGSGRGPRLGHLGDGLQADGLCLHPRAKVRHSPATGARRGPGHRRSGKRRWNKHAHRCLLWGWQSLAASCPGGCPVLVSADIHGCTLQ